VLRRLDLRAQLTLVRGGQQPHLANLLEITANQIDARLALLRRPDGVDIRVVQDFAPDILDSPLRIPHHTPPFDTSSRATSAPRTRL
jgi:hypothetical protein